MSSLLEHQLNIRFAHRVVFTHRVFDPANLTLIQLLAPVPAIREAPPRVLVTVDAGLERATPELAPAITRYFADHAGHATLAAPPQILPGGESAKQGWATAEHLLAAIHDHHLDRHGYVVALGGGAFLDMAGFATAIAHRGCRHIRLPSTTLAQADSGVGVKNGLNLFQKKNFVGTFAPPWAVVNDLDLLRTLEPRDLRAGLAEAVKVSLIRDAAFFEWLETHASNLARPDLPLLEEAVRRCAALHVQHITTCGDPFELGSARPLDFGHWAAHKLELLSGFTLRHGEAVALGVALDSLYSREADFLPPRHCARILALLRSLGFTLWHTHLASPELTRGIDDFREHLGGTLTLTLLRGIGQGFETHTYDTGRLPRCLAALRGLDAPGG